MKNTGLLYNEEAFTPEEVEQGLHMELITTLLNYNNKADDCFQDIRIWSDGYCTIVSWCKNYYDRSMPTAQWAFVDDEQAVGEWFQLPDNSHIFIVADDESRREALADWEEEHKDNIRKESDDRD